MFIEGGNRMEIKIISASKAEMKQIEQQAADILKKKGIDIELWRHEQHLKLVLDNLTLLTQPEEENK